MRRTGSLKVCITLVIITTLSLITRQAWGKYGGGSGTAEDPYLIYTAEQMNSIGLYYEDSDKYFKLMADIDLSAYTGMDFNIISYFSGTFDGNGHKIYNFNYYEPDGYMIGIFGWFSGTVKNLGLISPDIDTSTSDPNWDGGFFIGALIGYSDGGNISGCYIDGGSVSGNYEVGGLAGVFSNGTMTDCYSTCDVSGFSAVGGLVGLNDFKARIIRCNFSGSVSGANGYIGGLVGLNDGMITACYSAGSVMGVTYDYYEGTGGLVGVNSDDGIITHSYSTSDVSERYLVGGLVGVSYGRISDCYATGNAYGVMWIGGLLGGNAGYVYRCYSTGRAIGSSSVGGLVGGSEGGVTIGSFWDRQTSGNTSSVGGTGKTTSQMQTKSTFTSAGWNFTTPIWTIEDNDYPRLWWEENILYVPGYYPTIQAAIDAAVDGDTVVVAPGTYTGNGNRDIEFLGKAITVRGATGDPDDCIINCQGTEATPHRGFKFVSEEDEKTILEAVAITNGYGPQEDILGTGQLYSIGGAVYCNNSSPNISNCIINNNSASSGGGISTHEGSAPIINNCNIINNSSSSYGGGIYNVRDYPDNAIISNCIIKGNSAALGGGISNSLSSPKISNCIISNNSASCYGGGFYNSSSNPAVSNCTISGNSAVEEGGGIYNMLNSTSSINNCNIVNNSACYGSGMSNYSSDVVINNCIMWGNNPTPQIPEASSSVVVTYSDIQGGYTGMGNIDCDPFFVAADSNDFHLLPDSPCIDAGDPCSPWELEPWPNGARVNMGAYGNTPEATRSRDGLQFEGFNIIEKSRIDRTIFRYVLSLSLSNITEDNMTDVYVELIDASGQVINAIDDEIFYPLIEANSTVDSSSSEDYFIIEVDRSELITPGRLTWQVDYTRTDSSQMQMMSAAVPIEVTGDISGDGKVDFEDLWRLAEMWLWTGQAGEIAEDTFADGIVNFKDFAKIARGWRD